MGCKFPDYFDSLGIRNSDLEQIRLINSKSARELMPTPISITELR
jgi:hypothetical protein